MKWLRYLFSIIWRLWFFIVFLLVFIGFIPALYFFTAINKKPIVVAHLCRYWSKLTLFFSFIFPKVEWEESLILNDKYIFCPNHVSTLDIPFILSIIPHPIQFIGKVEIARLPIFGWFYKNNSVIVNRANRKDAYNAFIKAGEKINQGINMCIFPEGGIPPKKIFLKKFKNGAFKLSLEKEIKIVPVTLADNKKIFPKEYYKGYPGFVRVKVHTAISPKNLKEKTIKNLNNKVYNTIFEQLKNYEK